MITLLVLILLFVPSHTSSAQLVLSSCLARPTTPPPFPSHSCSPTPALPPCRSWVHCNAGDRRRRLDMLCLDSIAVLGSELVAPLHRRRYPQRLPALARSPRLLASCRLSSPGTRTVSRRVVVGRRQSPLLHTPPTSTTTNTTTTSNTRAPNPLSGSSSASAVCA